MDIKKENGKIIITDFNETQVFGIAMRIEKDGMGVYNYLAREAKEKELSNIFEFLYEQEKIHYGYFKKRYDILYQEAEDNPISRSDQQLIDLLDLGIFPSYAEMDKMLKLEEGMAEIIRTAAQVEQASIDFYSACLNETESPEVKKDLEKIIQEEEKHKEILESQN